MIGVISSMLERYLDLWLADLQNEIHSEEKNVKITQVETKTLKYIYCDGYGHLETGLLSHFGVKCLPNGRRQK